MTSTTTATRAYQIRQQQYAAAAAAGSRKVSYTNNASATTASPRTPAAAVSKNAVHSAAILHRRDVEVKKNIKSFVASAIGAYGKQIPPGLEAVDGLSSAPSNISRGHTCDWWISYFRVHLPEAFAFLEDACTVMAYARKTSDVATIKQANGLRTLISDCTYWTQDEKDLFASNSLEVSEETEKDLQESLDAFRRDRRRQQHNLTLSPAPTTPATPTTATGAAGAARTSYIKNDYRSPVTAAPVERKNMSRPSVRPAAPATPARKYQARSTTSSAAATRSALSATDMQISPAQLISLHKHLTMLHPEDEEYPLVASLIASGESALHGRLASKAAASSSAPVATGAGAPRALQSSSVPKKVYNQYQPATRMYAPRVRPGAAGAAAAAPFAASTATAMDTTDADDVLEFDARIDDDLLHSSEGEGQDEGDYEEDDGFEQVDSDFGDIVPLMSAAAFAAACTALAAPARPVPAAASSGTALIAEEDRYILPAPARAPHLAVARRLDFGSLVDTPPSSPAVSAAVTAATTAVSLPTKPAPPASVRLTRSMATEVGALARRALQAAASSPSSPAVSSAGSGASSGAAAAGGSAAVAQARPRLEHKREVATTAAIDEIEEVEEEDTAAAPLGKFCIMKVAKTGLPCGGTRGFIPIGTSTTDLASTENHQAVGKGVKLWCCGSHRKAASTHLAQYLA